MPYLRLHTNIEVDDKQTLLATLSQQMAELLGKPERYVMVELSDGQPMLFAGSDAPLAMLRLISLGLDASATAGISSALCTLLHKELGIEPQRVYIEFVSPARSMFGWNGGTF